MCQSNEFKSDLELWGVWWPARSVYSAIFKNTRKNDPFLWTLFILILLRGLSALWDVFSSRESLGSKTVMTGSRIRDQQTWKYMENDSIFKKLVCFNQRYAITELRGLEMEPNVVVHVYISAPGSLSQKDLKFKGSLAYIVRSYLNNTPPPQRKPQTKKTNKQTKKKFLTPNKNNTPIHSKAASWFDLEDIKHVASYEINFIPIVSTPWTLVCNIWKAIQRMQIKERR